MPFTQDLLYTVEGSTLCLSHQVLLQMHRHALANLEPGGLEACGLLIGTISEGGWLLTLSEITGPFPGDKRERFTCESSDPRHHQRAREVHRQSQGVTAAWGDWHTHAEPHPRASREDRHTWQKICATLNDQNRWHFALIMGTESLALHLLTVSGISEPLTPK